MPPDEPLSESVIADFEHRIQVGAPDSRDGPSGIARPQTDIEEGREFWTFKPITQPNIPPPRDANWPRSDIDRFILAALQQGNLHSVGDPDRITLLRRATLDLTGLPFTPEEVTAFVADQTPAAFETVVDRLLDSP
jgi:hypothetical protein